jgi:L-ascorbate oxidase
LANNAVGQFGAKNMSVRGSACFAFASIATLLSSPLFAATLSPLSTHACNEITNAFISSDHKSQIYRPPINFEPADRDVAPGRLQKARRVPLEFKLTVSELRIGGYVVSGVPTLQVKPDEGASAYYISPSTGHREAVPSICFSDPNFLKNWAYGGERLRLMQGDTLDVRFRSELSYSAQSSSAPSPPANGGAPCQASNIHTHGLLVRPTRGNSRNPYGDYVLDLSVPGAKLAPDECMQHPSRLAHVHGSELSEIHYSIHVPDGKSQDPTIGGSHPSGLFWFHPHPHGYSSSQVRGGTTGLITVGHLSDYASDLNSTSMPKPNIRFFMLKDVQISGVSDRNGEMTGDFNASGYDSSLCPDLTVSPWPIPAECADQTGKQRWVFTINGQQYPQISDIKPNQPEIWRIANASANVTYWLTLQKYGLVATAAKLPDRDSCDPRSDGVPAFQILSLDGVSISQLNSSQPTLCADKLLLMPGSRVEVKINPPKGGGDFELMNVSFSTGGDTWPQLALARITWPAPTITFTPLAVNGVRPSTSNNASLPNATAFAKDQFAKPPSQFSNSCMWSDDWERVILFVKKVGASQESPSVADNEQFGIISGIRQKGAETNQAYFLARGEHIPIRLEGFKALFQSSFDPQNPDQFYTPSYGHARDFGYVCTHLSPKPQTWIIENWTDEDHNFHIHQTRFSPVKYDSVAGQQAYFNFPACGPDVGNCADTNEAAILKFYQGASSDVFHDSVPIPHGVNLGMQGGTPFGCNREPGATGDPSDPNKGGDQPLCNPGRVSITIGFTRPEQVGRFVFHCHILEHEDKGMMAMIDVCDPKKPCDADVQPENHSDLEGFFTRLASTLGLSGVTDNASVTEPFCSSNARTAPSPHPLSFKSRNQQN